MGIQSNFAGEQRKRRQEQQEREQSRRIRIERMRMASTSREQGLSTTPVFSSSRESVMPSSSSGISYIQYHLQQQELQQQEIQHHRQPPPVPAVRTKRTVHPNRMVMMPSNTISSGSHLRKLMPTSTITGSTTQSTTTANIQTTHQMQPQQHRETITSRHEFLPVQTTPSLFHQQQQHLHLKPHHQSRQLHSPQDVSFVSGIVQGRREQDVIWSPAEQMRSASAATLTHPSPSSVRDRDVSFLPSPHLRHPHATPSLVYHPHPHVRHRPVSAFEHASSSSQAAHQFSRMMTPVFFTDSETDFPSTSHIAGSVYRQPYDHHQQQQQQLHSQHIYQNQAQIEQHLMRMQSIARQQEIEGRVARPIPFHPSLRGHPFPRGLTLRESQRRRFDERILQIRREREAGKKSLEELAPSNHPAVKPQDSSSHASAPSPFTPVKETGNTIQSPSSTQTKDEEGEDDVELSDDVSSDETGGPKHPDDDEDERLCQV